MHEDRQGTSFTNDLVRFGWDPERRCKHYIIIIYSYYYLCGKTLKGRRQCRRPLAILYAPPSTSSSSSIPLHARLLFIISAHTNRTSIYRRKSPMINLCVCVCVCVCVCGTLSRFYMVVSIARARKPFTRKMRETPETTPQISWTRRSMHFLSSASNQALSDYTSLWL